MRRYLLHFVVSATYFLLVIRFFRLISQYAVNVLFWDPWDFDDATLFEKHSIWEMFRWQHGWHRQGLGALSQKVIEPWIHWNGRYEAFILGAVIVGVALLALLLKVRMYGRVGYIDVIVPLFFFSPLQYESLVWSPNPSQYSLPLLLAIVYCFCWLIRNYQWKYICVSLVNFFLVYSGFGIFMGPVTPVLLALDYYANGRHREPKYRWSCVAAFTVSIATLASFFVGYRFLPGVDCFSPGIKNPIAYPWFIALMFAHAGGLRGLGFEYATLVGGVALLAFLIGLLVTVKRLLAQKSEEWPHNAAIAVLLGYSAIFCLNASYARTCLGFVAAGTSRYTPYVILGLFGLYLWALSIRRRELRVSLVLTLLAFAVLGARPLNAREAADNEHFCSGKRVWRECYLRRHDIYQCEALTHFQIYPRPEETHLQEKLDFLEQNHLNLFDGAR